MIWVWQNLLDFLFAVGVCQGVMSLGFPPRHAPAGSGNPLPCCVPRWPSCCSFWIWRA